MIDVDTEVESAKRTIEVLANPDRMTQEQTLEFYEKLEEECGSMADAMREEMGDDV